MSDRRRFPRVEADVLCRPAGSRLLHHKRNTRDLSLGGVRVYTDDDFPVGSRLELDVMARDGEPIRCWAVVVWRLELFDGSPARFDTGLRFIDMAEDDIQRLAAHLGPTDQG